MKNILIQLEQPILFNLDPAQGNITGGTLVTVLGSGFFSTPVIYCK
jgi:hypothetical protein